jgi:hypothetical protein
VAWSASSRAPAIAGWPRIFHSPNDFFPEHRQVPPHSRQFTRWLLEIKPSAG